VIARAATLVSALVSALVLAGPGGAVASANPADPPGALTFGGVQRSYLVHVPFGLQNPSGLVINLHGAGMTGRDQAGLTNYNAVADQFGFVVAYPDGIDLSWADGRGASVPDRQGVDDVGFLTALVERLVRDYRVPPGRVFVTGMSAGAFMANRLACQRADLVAAVVAVAGTLGSGGACAPSRPVSVLQIHGTADPVVPFTGGPMIGRGGPSDVVAAPALAEQWRGIDQCPGPLIDAGTVGPTVRMVATGCAQGTEVVFLRVDGGGHFWTPDASWASGEFFATHGR